VTDEFRPRGRAGVLAQLESMSPEERLPILKELLPDLTDCQLSGDTLCAEHRKLNRIVICPTKGGYCRNCCPEHQCEGAQGSRRERVQEVIRQVRSSYMATAVDLTEPYVPPPWEDDEDDVSPF